MYRINENYFSIHNKLQELIDNKFFCNSSEKLCVNNIGIDVKKEYGYKIFFRKITK